MARDVFRRRGPFLFETCFKTERERAMTRLEYAELCDSRLIAPDIALECDRVVAALKENNREELILALEEEF
jgi:hypothetical protein